MNNLKIGDKVRIKTSVTLEDIKANHFNGCQLDTMIFLVEQSSFGNDFDNTFEIVKVTNQYVKLKNVIGLLNKIIFEKIEKTEKIKEMTVEEISKALGYEVKVVK